MAESGFFQNELTKKIARFLNEIGIPTIPAKLDRETFLPGILVREGTLLVDEENLAFPGDLLHEAGHLAVAPAEIRHLLGDEVIVPQADLDALEVEAIAWSYAACLHLQIDPRVVFHESGYKGKSENLLLNFALGVFVGISGLESGGMTYSEMTAREKGAAPFPAMRRWLKD